MKPTDTIVFESIFDWVITEPKSSACRRGSLTAFPKVAGLFNPGERNFGRLDYVVFNDLLHDDAHSRRKSIFPSQDENRVLAQTSPRRLWVPTFRRLADLAFRRVGS
jgi:hypothetical protein